jgi:hypothetical protein
MYMYVKPNDKIEDNSNMFGVEVSWDESSWVFIIRNLSLFKRLSILLVAYEDPFA